MSGCALCRAQRCARLRRAAESMLQPKACCSLGYWRKVPPCTASSALPWFDTVH